MNDSNPIQKVCWLGTGPLAEGHDFNDKVFSELVATINYHRWDELRPDLDRLAKGDAAAKLMNGTINVLTCRIMRGEEDLSRYLISETATKAQEPLPAVVLEVAKDYLNGGLTQKEAIRTLGCAAEMYKRTLRTLRENVYNPILRPNDVSERLRGVRPEPRR